MEKYTIRCETCGFETETETYGTAVIVTENHEYGEERGFATGRHYCEILKVFGHSKSRPTNSQSIGDNVMTDTITTTNLERAIRSTDDDGNPYWRLQTRDGFESIREIRLRAEHFAEGTVITIEETIQS